MYKFHGTCFTHVTESSPHRSCTATRRIDRTFLMPATVATKNSPLLALTPTKMPFSHLGSILLAIFSAFFLYITFSPNSTPITVKDFPRFLSVAVLPSLPTSSLFSKYAAYSAKNVTTLDFAEILNLIRFSSASLRARI